MKRSVYLRLLQNKEQPVASVRVKVVSSFRQSVYYYCVSILDLLCKW